MRVLIALIDSGSNFNLPPPHQVIDLIVEQHWWNITQFLVSVLEGNYPKAVKEQVSHLYLAVTDCMAFILFVSLWPLKLGYECSIL